MIALLQRVTQAGVSVDGHNIASIGGGILALVAVVPSDAEPQANRLAERLLNYRLFADDHGRMNLNVLERGGELLLVPQFTLAADTRHGNRPGFSGAAPPDQARALFDALCQRVVAQGLPADRLQCGRFGADMLVTLSNDGPVTFWLES